MIITYESVIQTLVQLSVLTILVAVIVDFLFFDRRGKVKRGQQSIVRTSTMLLFALAFYLVVRFRWGALTIGSRGLAIGLDLAGLLLLGGAAFNIAGRLKLGWNWGDNIKIYTDHALVTGGPYHLVRHPLYASLIWMFCGGALVYRNPLALLLNAVVFVPFMTWRARQEEQLLLKEFPAYESYRRRTGMFFPRLGRR